MIRFLIFIACTVALLTLLTAHMSAAFGEEAPNTADEGGRLGGPPAEAPPRVDSHEFFVPNSWATLST